MASLSSTINLIISGSTRGLSAAAAEAEATARRVADAEDRASAARTRAENASGNLEQAERRLEQARSAQQVAAQRVSDQEDRINGARARSEQASARVLSAETHLEAVRNRSGATAADITRAEEQVNRVRTASDQASRRLQQAEAQLATARGNAERSSSRVGAAEDAVARARSAATRASEGAASAENDLNNLRRRGNQDVDRQRSGLLGVFDAFSRLGNAVTGADDASNKFLSTGAALQNLFGTIGGPIVQAVAGIAQVAVILAVAIEAIGLIGGVIGQALAGAPALLLALGFAAGTVVLGMDGIKKAAESLKGPIDKLKASVSTVFEKALTPAFKELAAALPKLTDGFDDVALSISIIAQKAIGFLTSAKGVDALNTALAGTVNFLQALAPGITAFLAGLVNAAAAAKPAMAALGTAIGDIFGKIGDVFTKLSNNGVITAAVAGLAATIKGLSNVLGPVVELLLRMGAALGDSLGTSLTSIGAGIEQVTPFFEHLAKVAGDLLVAAFDQLGPPIRELVDTILPGAHAGLDGFATFITTTVLPAVAGFINWLRTDGIPGFLKFVSACADAALSFTSTMLGMVSNVLGGLSILAAGLASIPSPWAKDFAAMAEATHGSQQKVDDLRGSIDALHPKIVDAIANSFGEPKVHTLFQAIEDLHDKTVTVTTLFVGSSPAAVHLAGYASGGRPPVGVPFLVGEQGPELLTLDGRGGVITPAAKTRSMLDSATSTPPQPFSGGGGGGAPVYVTVELDGQPFAARIRAEVDNRDRQVKRTVLAGSGATY